MTQESQVDIEELWRASDLKWAEQKREENCVGWIAHYEHLVGVYRERLAHAEEQVERFEKFLSEKKRETA